MSDRNPLPFQPVAHDDADLAQRLAALYRATPAPDAAQADRCARAVLAQAMHQSSRTTLGVPLTRWWWGAAAAAVLMTAILRPWRGTPVTTSADRTTIAASAADALQGTVTSLRDGAVRFDLRLPTTASAVAIVGDFNGWDQQATPMATRDRSGTWSANIQLLPGRHVYAFVVDGKRWVVDPLAPQVPDDGYGPANAVVIDGLPK
jgi:hypothetical protein